MISGTVGVLLTFNSDYLRMNEMKKLMVLITLFGMIGFSGCSVHQFWYGENKPAKSYAELPSKATLFIWNPKTMLR